MRLSLLALSFGLGVYGGLCAQTINTDSPFLPVGGQSAAPAAARTNPAGIEFCGIMERNGEPWFCLFETATGKGRWLAMNRESEGWVVRSYDAATREVSVDLQGQVQVLALKQPRLDGAATVAVAPANPGLPPGVVPPVMVPTAADEATRLKTVADEIKRRRALRAAAMSGANGQGVGGGPVPVPAPNPNQAP